MCGNLSKSRSSAIKYKIIPIKIKIGILLNNISGIIDIKKQIIIVLMRVFLEYLSKLKS